MQFLIEFGLLIGFVFLLYKAAYHGTARSYVKTDEMKRQEQENNREFRKQ